MGRHDLRAGGDHIRLFPVFNATDATLSVASQGIDALLAGVPLGITTSYFLGPTFNVQKYPFWGQDTVHVSDSLQILLGFRWELAPSPFSYNQGYIPPSFFTGNWDGTDTSSPIVLSSAHAQGARWPTRYNQFAPRAGLAYHFITPGLVLRAGAGMFYETDLGSLVSDVNPLNSWNYAPATAVPNIPF